MLTKQQLAAQRFGGKHQAVDAWLGERQQLLVGYVKIAGLPPYERADHALPDSADIRDFCNLLVDYVSAGHFEIYGHIIRNSQSAPDTTRELADDLFPLISDTTEIALEFNDRFAERHAEDNFNGFDQAVSQLGEALELRMGFEDQLLATLVDHQLLTVTD
jgi:regulator of sigma D